MNIPDFTVPAPLAGLHRMLPKRPPSMALAAALNLAAGRGVLPVDTVALLEGRSFVVEATDAAISACFTVHNGSFSAIDRPETPDLYFGAKACDLPGWHCAKKIRTRCFSRAASTSRVTPSWA